MLISCNRHGRCWLSSLFPRWLVRSHCSRLSMDRSVHDRPSPEWSGCSSFKLVVAKICCICSNTCIHLASNYQKTTFFTRTTHASPTCFIPPTHYSWSSCDHPSRCTDTPNRKLLQYITVFCFTSNSFCNKTINSIFLLFCNFLSTFMVSNIHSTLQDVKCHRFGIFAWWIVIN